MSADPMLVNNRFVLGMRSGEEYCEQRSAEEENQTASPSNVSNRLDWNMVALWLFVTICFGALAFALYVIWGKCRGDIPY